MRFNTVSTGDLIFAKKIFIFRLLDTGFRDIELQVSYNKD